MTFAEFIEFAEITLGRSLSGVEANDYLDDLLNFDQTSELFEAIENLTGFVFTANLYEQIDTFGELYEYV